WRQLRLQQVERLADDLFDVHRRALARIAATERENRFDECTAALARSQNLIEVAPKQGAPACAAARPLAVAEDGAEDVVEIVRDAPGERTHRFEPLRVAQTLLQLLLLVLLALALVDVADRAHHAIGPAVCIAQRDPALIEPA